MDIRQEIIDSIKILSDDAANKKTSPIYFGLVSSISGNKCKVTIHNKQYDVVYYGMPPIVNNKYPVFVPYSNMGLAFIITGQNSKLDAWPINSVYTSIANVSPQDNLGGTWEYLGTDGTYYRWKRTA